MSTAVEYADPPTARGRPWLASKHWPSGMGQKPCLSDHLKELAIRVSPLALSVGGTRLVSAIPRGVSTRWWMSAWMSCPVTFSAASARRP